MSNLANIPFGSLFNQVYKSSPSAATNKAALSTLINPGSLAMVQLQSNLAIYLFDIYTTLSADGNFVIAPPSGTGKWIRQFWGHDQWQSQATWYIDPVSGNDENDGATLGTALKTVRELSYRLGGEFSVTMTVNILNSLPSTDPLELFLYANKTGNDDDPYPYFIVQGSKTVIATGTVTASSAEVPASNTAATLTDTGVSDWTPYLGKHVEITTAGADLGKVCVIAKDLGSNQARISPWASVASGGATTAPAPGSIYQIIDFVDVGNPAIFIANEITRTGAFPPPYSKIRFSD